MLMVAISIPMNAVGIGTQEKSRNQKKNLVVAA